MGNWIHQLVHHILSIKNMIVWILLLNGEAPWLVPQIPPSKDTQDDEYLFQPDSTWISWNHSWYKLHSGLYILSKFPTNVMLDPTHQNKFEKKTCIYIYKLKSFQQNYSLCRNAPWNNPSLLHFLAVRSWPACRWQSIRWNAKAAWVALCSVFSKSRILSLDTLFEALQI